MGQVSRRAFVTQTASVAAVALAYSIQPIQTWAAAEHTPVGLELFTVREALTKDPAGTLQKIAAMGYKEVEVSGFAGLSPTALRKLIDNTGLVCPAAHLDFGFKDTAQVLNDAHELRVTYAASSILLPTQEAEGLKGIAQLNTATAEDYKHIAARANRIGAQAKKAGVQYAYHNHAHEFRDLGGGQKGYDILLAETDPDLVQFEADCGWMITGGGNPVEYFRRYPNRYRVIHVKDFPASTKPFTGIGANMPHPTELGRGHIDYKPILLAAKRAGVEHFFVEQDPPMVDMTPLEAVKTDYSYMHTALDS